MDFFRRISIYDQFGYLLVGASAALLLVFNFFLLGVGGSIYTGTNIFLESLVFWFVISYFLGHLIQAISNLFNQAPILKTLLPKGDKFSSKQKEVLDKFSVFLSVEDEDYKYLWRLCYAYVKENSRTDEVELFNAYYSLYRGWFVVFLINTLFFLVLVILGGDSNLWYLVIALGFAGYLFRKRAVRFYNYTRNKVLNIFLVLHKDKQRKGI